MAESEARPPEWVAEQMRGRLKIDAEVVFVERRPSTDMYRANASGRSLLVKVGSSARLAHEAAALKAAVSLVGDLAPAFTAYTETDNGPSLLAMEYVAASPLEPGRLTRGAWAALTDGLIRLHRNRPETPPLFAPLAPDFVTLSVGEGRYASLAELRPLLAAQVALVPSLDVDSALGLFDNLAADVEVRPELFERAPSWVHGDIWPENVLTSGSRCWLVDWTWLKHSDYALDLANLKLMLDWVWPPVRAHLMFEGLLRRYAAQFADNTLLARMRFYLPLVSLIHLVQFGEGGADDPENAVAMSACLAKAPRDRTLWSLRTPRGRLLFAALNRRKSEYATHGSREGWERAAQAVVRVISRGKRAVQRRVTPLRPAAHDAPS
jgi:streptomycin 6-kinase